MRKFLEKFNIKINRRLIVRRNFLINCIVLTIISVIITLGASKLLFKHTLPEENFVTVEIVATLELDCDYLSDTGIDSLECEDEVVEIYSTRGSAAAFKRKESQTFLLTAEHFCNTSDISAQLPSSLLPLVEIKRYIYKNGKKYPFEILKVDRASDLCLIVSDYPIKEELKIAKEMPELGERTVTISSPLGIAEKGISLHFAGTYSGCNGPICFFTIPTISGSSGSLILNHEKEVVSITQKSLVGFPNVAIGVHVDKITEFILEYESESGEDITP